MIDVWVTLAIDYNQNLGVFNTPEAGKDAAEKDWAEPLDWTELSDGRWHSERGRYEVRQFEVTA